MRSNISDHSCHHYARQLLALIAGRGALGGAEPSRLAAIFRDEIALNAELIGAHPGSESFPPSKKFVVFLLESFEFPWRRDLPRRSQ